MIFQNLLNKTELTEVKLQLYKFSPNIITIMPFVTKEESLKYLFGDSLSSLNPDVKPKLCDIVRLWIYHYDGGESFFSLKNKRTLLSAMSRMTLFHYLFGNLNLQWSCQTKLLGII